MMELLNPFDQLFNKILLYSMLGNLQWVKTSRNSDLVFNTVLDDLELEWIGGDFFIVYYRGNERQFVHYMTPTQANQLMEVLSNNTYNWNDIP